MLSQREVFKPNQIDFFDIGLFFRKPVLRGALLRGKKLKKERFIIWLSLVWCLRTVESH
jgi:hypothetical protein